MTKPVPKLSIRFRLIVLFMAQVLVVLGIAGFYLNWHLRNLLEAELGEKLELAASAVASQIDAELVTRLRPGDEGTRTYHNLQKRLREIRKATGVRRIYIADEQHGSLVDTEQDMPVGKTILRLELDDDELARVWNGETANSVLFQGADDRLYKSGYAPLNTMEQVRAVVVVEGSAHTLEAVARLRASLLRLAAIGVILAVLFAVLFSDRLTRPLNRLSRSADTIGRGNYGVPITVKGRDEIAFLAKTMEEMRQGVVQRDTRLKAMLAGVAHEIRNPLGGIELFAGLLMDDLRGKAQKEQAQKILKEVQTLKAIVNDFLDYARPASPKRQSCRLDEVLSEVHMLLSEELLQSKSRLTWSTNELAVTIDPQHAQQIFLNLVKNSLQAMPHGGDINVKARSSDGQVEIMVSDSGMGIQKQACDQLFEPFFTTRKTGTGLGLAIVKSLCQANGGDIRLSTSDSSGTTFKLVFVEAKEDDDVESSADN